jgi:dihydroflavonol-4-reductase
MRAVLTGATGLLGAHVASALIERGDEVVCTRRSTSRTDHLAHLPVTWVDASLSQPEALARAFDGADAVFHCAALVQVRARATPAMEKANVEGSRHVLDAVRRAGVGRLVHCSSASAVGLATGAADANEDSPLNFAEDGVHDGYVDTKHRSEQLVRQAAEEGLDAVVVNPGYFFGAYDVRPSSGAMILAVAAGRTRLYTEGTNSYLPAADVAAGMLAAHDRGRSGRRYLLTGTNLTYRQIFTRIAAVVGVAPPRWRAPTPVLRGIGRLGDAYERLTDREALLNGSKVGWSLTDRYRFDHGRARDELGFQPGPPERGIEAAWRWFRDHGMA